jgi:hypothetical protein
MQLRITSTSATATTIVWFQGDGCQYPAARLRFTLNRATTVWLLLPTADVDTDFFDPQS